MDNARPQFEKALGPMECSGFTERPDGSLYATMRLGDDIEEIVIDPATVLRHPGNAAYPIIKEKLNTAIKALKDRARVTA